MLTRILLAALLAGVLSGVFVTAVQALRVTPLILEAEKYENPAEPVQTQAADETWAPEGGFERTFYTMVNNIFVGISFSLILVAGVLLTKSSMTLKSGLVWGLGGFLVFVLAPNFGLSPDLPGMGAAELKLRQGWWVATVVLTAAALLIFAFRQKLVWMIGGLVLLLAPHIYGAPVLANPETLVPAALAAEFVVATIVTSLLFWLVLGGVLGWLVERIGRKQNIGEQLS